MLDNSSSVDDDRRVTDNSTAPARSLDDLRAQRAMLSDELTEIAVHGAGVASDAYRRTNRTWCELDVAIEQAEADEQAAQADEVDLDAALVETLSAMQRAKLDAVRDMLVRKADDARALCTRADEQGSTVIRARARTRYQSYSTALAEFDRLTR